MAVDQEMARKVTTGCLGLLGAALWFAMMLTFFKEVSVRNALKGTMRIETFKHEKTQMPPDIAFCPGFDAEYANEGFSHLNSNNMTCSFKHANSEIVMPGIDANYTMDDVADEALFRCLTWTGIQLPLGSFDAGMMDSVDCTLDNRMHNYTDDTTYVSENKSFFLSVFDGHTHAQTKTDVLDPGDMLEITPNARHVVSLTRHDMMTVGGKVDFSWYERSLLTTTRFEKTDLLFGTSTVSIGYEKTSVVEHHILDVTRNNWEIFAMFGGGTLLVVAIVFAIYMLIKKVAGWNSSTGMGLSTFADDNMGGYNSVPA